MGSFGSPRHKFFGASRTNGAQTASGQEIVRRWLLALLGPVALRVQAAASVAPGFLAASVARTMRRHSSSSSWDTCDRALGSVECSSYPWGRALGYSGAMRKPALGFPTVVSGTSWACSERRSGAARPTSYLT